MEFFSLLAYVPQVIFFFAFLLVCWVSVNAFSLVTAYEEKHSLRTIVSGYVLAFAMPVLVVSTYIQFGGWLFVVMFFLQVTVFAYTVTQIEHEYQPSISRLMQLFRQEC